MSPDRTQVPASTRDRFLSTAAPLETELPPDLATSLGRLLGRPPVETVAEWVAAVRREIGGGPIGVEDLCHEETETPHWGELDGERFHFTCFYDAVVLAAIVGDPVDVHTESPEGTAIEAKAVGSADLEVDPPTAVFSFGVPEAVDPPAGEPRHGDVYAAVCPYVRAFPDLASYDHWRRSVPAATVAMPMAGSTELAAALVAE